MAADGLVADVAVPAVLALAGVAAVRIEAAAAVQARIVLALVNVRLAEGADVAGVGAVAAESIDAIDAAAVVLARLRGTLVHVDFAARPRITLRTLAGGAGAAAQHNAGAVIQTGIRLAKRMDVHLRLAVLSTVIRMAHALIVAP